MNLPPFKRTDLSKIRTRGISNRPSKVSHELMVMPASSNASVRSFLTNLPQQLGASALRGLVFAIIKARQNGLPVIFGCGAHLIKLGLGPHLCQLIKAGLVSHIAANGAFFIHDWELARVGKTSEDVANALLESDFGMATETAVEMNQAVENGVRQDWGIGYSLGKKLLQLGGLHLESSILATACQAQVGVSAHVAIGAEINHMHPSFSGAAWGEASHLDFRQLSAVVAEMGNGGVYVNVGSAVIMPEVFLKALSIARNIDPNLGNIITGNLDMIRHYRPGQNVLIRPKLLGGQAYEIIGQLELTFPLLCYGLMEEQQSSWTGTD